MSESQRAAWPLVRLTVATAAAVSFCPCQRGRRHRRSDACWGHLYLTSLPTSPASSGLLILYSHVATF